MIASLAFGGAERIVCETIATLHDRAAGRLFVLWDAPSHYNVHETASFKLHHWSGTTREARLLEAAQQLLRSGSNLLFTHLITVRDLQVLWRAGIKTVPVIHNAKEGWQDPPASFASAHVPFVIAVSDFVASELRENGCAPPVLTVRHELQRWFSDESARQNRVRIRRQHGIADDVFLIGMVGSFKAQKAYPRAARVLAEVKKVRPAKLMVLGSWDHDYCHGRVTFEVFRRLVADLGLEEDVLLPGQVDPVDPYYSAFDAYLNTSVYEGLSIALLEAQQWGCPVVTADAGGNREALAEGSILVRDPSDIGAYAEALKSIPCSARRVAERPAYSDLVPRIWSLLASHGVDHGRPRSGVLFVTNNLNMGGAQRSLTNLLVDLPDKKRTSICVLGAIHGRQFLDELLRASVRVITFDKPANIVDTAERVIEAVGRLNVETVCFWNADACVKLLVTKILSCTAVRIVDVSPGSSLFREFDETRDFQRRIAYSESDYTSRLHAFVCKCHAAKSSPRLMERQDKVVVIPNGVPAVNAANPLKTSAAPAMTIGTCGRIAPENRIEFLIESFALVAQRFEAASLTIVGEAQAGRTRYKESLLKRVTELGLKQVHFAGATENVSPWLRSFRVFVTAFGGEGCPNAVLEAMAAGTPVVATASPSNEELVRSGVNGFIVSDTDPHDMAAKIEVLFTRPEVTDSMGRASELTARQNFSMQRMVDSYRSLLAC